MKRGKSIIAGHDGLRREYTAAELKNGVRGKYYKRYTAGTNLVRLDADLSKAFPNDKSVNAALRLLLNAAKKAMQRRA